VGHFAKVVDGIVTNVIVAEPEFFNDFNDPEPGEWIQTSYNTRGGIHYGQDGNPDGGVALRKNYATIGDSYDADRDAFIPYKKFESWVLNEDTCLWEAPIEQPIDGNKYIWNEDNLGWELVPEEFAGDDVWVT
jgi:hypothetical protein